MFAIDASAMLPWVFDDEDDPIATQAASLAVDHAMTVPALWWFEMRNALVMAERRKRITPEDTHVFLGRLAGLTLLVDRSPDETTLLNLARKHRLTAYDAAYLELAKRKTVALATLDAELAKAARDEGVALVAPPSDRPRH